MKSQNDIFADPQRAKKIYDIVRRMLESDQRPNSIEATNFQIKYGEDSSGNLGVWVSLLIDDDVKPSNEKIKQLNNFAKLILDTIIEEDAGIWPYIQYVDKLPDADP